MIKTIRLLSLSLVLCMASAIATANTYVIYSAPNNHAQRIGTLTKNNASIFLQFHQEGPWLELGNELNGQVGWVNIKKPQQTTQTHSRLAKHVLLHDQLAQIEQQRAFYYNMQKKLNTKLDQLHHSLNQEESQITQEIQTFTQNAHHPLKTVSVLYTKNHRIATKKWQDTTGKTHTKEINLPSNTLSNPQVNIALAKPPHITW